MSIAFQWNSFQTNSFQTLNEMFLSVSEGADVPAINVNIVGTVTFNISEGADVPSFGVTSTTLSSFNLNEGADVPSISITSKTTVTFGVTEGADLPSFNVLTGARFSFNLSEGQEGIIWRVWAGDFTLGDADYIFVPEEKITILVPEVVDVLYVDAAVDFTNVRDEWQRIDVDQSRGGRRDT